MRPNTILSKRSFRPPGFMLVLTSVLTVTSLGLLGQTPAPGAPPPAGVGAAVGQSTTPPDTAGRGAGGGGGGRAGDPFAGADLTPKPAIQPASPSEELKRFVLMPGYKLELVLAEPDIKEPMQLAFDGNGRMYVLEMRSYMQDADAIDQLAPISVISWHEDADKDGVYDKHGVFVDHLVVPRFVTPFGPNAILTMESNADEVWKYTDTDGDGKADKKELFATNFGRSANIEHQQSSLFWSMDNWMYSTINAFRVRWTPRGVIRETTGSPGSQWGAAQDNYGKQYFQGGASGLPGYFQFPLEYGTFNWPQQLAPGLNTPWGIAGLGDYQGGTGMIRAGELTLGSTTAGAGNMIYRGDRLPPDLVGDYFYGEQTARIVRRLHPVNIEGLTQMRNVYQPLHAEFIRSLDPLFRPVWSANAPDGTIYIDDVYRGIIQEGNWTRPSSYLRAKVDQYAMASITNHGRIWRLTYEGMPRDTTQPRMFSETTAELVRHLEHPNGWWRDTAQQLLILRQDKSSVPALKTMVQTSKSEFGRYHALWTLEGLGALDASLVREAMSDASAQMRIQALRASETLYKSGDKSFANDYRTSTKDKNTDVVIQALLILNTLKVSDAMPSIRSAMDGNKAAGVQFVANGILNPSSLNTGRGGGGGGAPALTPEQQNLLERGGVVYQELCFTCHGDDGRGAPRPGAPAGVTMAPSLAASPRVLGHRDYVIKAVLHGLTGTIDGKTYTEVMIPMGSNKDEWVASVASYVRNSFGNAGAFITPADVARVRAATTGRKQPWAVDELLGSLPQQIVVDATWKATASHNPAAASAGLNFGGWTSLVPQTAGMWFQIELPRSAILTEIQFESAAGGRGGGVPGARVGGAGAAGPAAPPQPTVAAAGAQPPTIGFPRGYQVQVSADGSTWSAPIAAGKGEGASTVITFKPTPSRFVRITQTGTVENSPAWSIQRLRLYEAAGTKPVAK